MVLQDCTENVVKNLNSYFVQIRNQIADLYTPCYLIVLDVGNRLFEWSTFHDRSKTHRQNARWGPNIPGHHPHRPPPVRQDPFHQLFRKPQIRSVPSLPCPNTLGYVVYGGDQSMHTDAGALISRCHLDRIPDGSPSAPTSLTYTPRPELSKRGVFLQYRTTRVTGSIYDRLKPAASHWISILVVRRVSSPASVGFDEVRQTACVFRTFVS